MRPAKSPFGPWCDLPGDTPALADLLDEMVAEAEALGLYDLDISPCTCGRRPPCRHIDDEDHPPVPRN